MDENTKTGYPALDSVLPVLLGGTTPALPPDFMILQAVKNDAGRVARDLLRLARNGLPAVMVAEAVARFADSVRKAAELASAVALARGTARETIQADDAGALGGRAARSKGAAKSPAKTKGGRARRCREEGREADNGRR